MNLAEDIRDITFHSCRATMVDLSAAAGCSIAQILTQMRSMSPEVAMRYIRENGSMVAQVSEDIKEMLIKKDNALLTDAADEMMNKTPEKRSQGFLEKEPVRMLMVSMDMLIRSFPSGAAGTHEALQR